MHVRLQAARLHTAVEQLSNVKEMRSPVVSQLHCWVVLGCLKVCGESAALLVGVGLFEGLW